MPSVWQWEAENWGKTLEVLEYLPAGNQGKTQEKIKYLPVGKPKDTAGCKMLALRVQIQEASCRKTRWEKSS